MMPKLLSQAFLCSRSNTDLSEAGGSAPSDSPPPSLPPGAPSSRSSSSTDEQPSLTRVGADSQGRAAQGAVAPPCPWEIMGTEGLVLARSSQSSTGYEGVYASGDGFGAELQRGAKRLRQDGFRSILEAAMERARWLKSREEGKGHAPAVAARVSSGQEQLAAEALVGLVAAAVAPTVTQLSVVPVKEAAAHSTHDEEGRSTMNSTASNRGDEQLLGRAASAQVITAGPMLGPMLNQRGRRAAEAAQVANQQGAAPGCSTASTLKERLVSHVLCNYTPRHPGKLSKKRWVSCDELHRQLQPLTSSEAEIWQPAYVKQLVMELFKNHPLFAGLSFSEWGKKLINRDALAHSAGKTHVTCFSLEHTPTANGRCGSSSWSSRFVSDSAASN